MVTYEQLVRTPYDPVACPTAYEELLKDPDNPALIEKAWELSMPMLGCVMHSHFSGIKVGSEEFDEIMSAVSLKLYQLLTSARFRERYYVNRDTHFSYLFGICRLEVITVLNKLRRPMDAPVFVSQSNLDASPAATYYKLFTKDLPRMVTEYVNSKMRFTGEHGELCKFLTDQLVAGKGIPIVVVRRRWGTKNVNFFIGYVRALIRAALWEIKKDFCMMVSAEDATLADAISVSIQDVFGEGLRADTVFDWGLDKHSTEEGK